MLELEIKNLTAAITELTSFLKAADLAQQVPPEQPSQAVDVAQIEKPSVETKEYTHDMLKAACLASSRESADNKPKLKALLKEYGANKAADVLEHDLAKLIGLIESGEF